MITIKNRYIAAFITVTMLLANVPDAHAFASDSGTENKSVEGNCLVIRHIAKSPEGREQILGEEKIENLTDVYYYRASVSPVASKFLKSGYSLSDEKNRVIEADVVSNGGRIDLEYTPSVQDISVTYYKNENGAETKIGTINDKAYVGEIYKPAPPVYEGEDILAEIIGDDRHTVRYGENNFKASYIVSEKPREGFQSSDAVVSSVAAEADNLSKEELFKLLYCLSGKPTDTSENALADAVAFLREKEVIRNEEAGLTGLLTWREFYAYIERFNDKLPENGKITAIERGQRSSYFDADRFVKKAEAVAAIDEMLIIDNIGFDALGAGFQY